MYKFAFLRFDGKEIKPENFIVAYKPWIHKNDKWYRTHRASENVKEWSIIAIPLFAALSWLGNFLPLVGNHPGVMSVAGSLLYNFFAIMYYFGYTESEEKRIPWFKGRMRIMLVVLVG